MLLNGGELDGMRLLGRKTVELMTANHLPGGQDVAQLALPGSFTDTPYAGVGFGLGFSVMQSPARAHIPGSPGDLRVGRRGEHRVLDRSRRGAHRHLHDAAHAVLVVSADAASCAC